ncbi:MAG TPA: thioredoxin domain-containing protein [Opitutaceae bacterium]|nr:thioredoxin domain-containing protein [Opitutaceae bacterium]
MSANTRPGTPKRGHNRLASEQSPYLRQHAGNPVDWFPWGEEAFVRARESGRPIFLSIGYSTCHWCHVMARESFEDPAVAESLNRDFVCVKVDREERPDVDRLYMAYVQTTTGHGGWPMSVWLTPDLAPFFGGTYFPPVDMQGRIGFPRLLSHIAEAWRTKREELVAEGNRIIEAFRTHATAAQPENASTPAVDVGQRCLEWCFEAFDDQWGGFGGAPKFPRPSLLNFLFRISARRDAQAAGELTPDGREALRFEELTLQRMAEGGMRDHLGGGFHRYSVDARWHVPHFEKMLYDQAQLVGAFLEGYQATGRGVFGWIARETIDYVLRDMTSSGGGFFSAEDADSDTPDGGHAEGAFYVWTQDEIRAVCGEHAPLVERHYGVSAGGNARPESDPQGEFRGKNILHQVAPLTQTAAALGIALGDAETRLLGANEKLFRARGARPRPHLDDKVLTAWNGLMISALARAVQVLGPDDLDAAVRWEKAASRAAEFVERELHDPATSRLWRGFRESRGAAPGFAEDYAFLIQGLLDLYEATGATRWLQWADRLQETMDADFWDANAGGYFSSPAGDPHLLVRLKEDYDGAEPAANSVAALNLLRLDAMLGGGTRADRARETIEAFRAQLDRAPHGLPQMLVAVDFMIGPVRQIVIAGDPGSADTRALLRAVHGRLEAPRVILWADGAEGQVWLAGRQPWIAGVKPVGGRGSASVCRDNTCGLPVTDPEELARQLA